MSKIGIVVLNYNDYKETREYIDTIKKFRTINEIVVVDNNSTDASYEVLKRMEKGNITVLKAKENNGRTSERTECKLEQQAEIQLQSCILR